MIKYYVKLNADNEILKPYSDEGTFLVPDNTTEITYDQLTEYLKIKNKGLVVSLVNGELVSYDASLSPTTIHKARITKIKTLLSETDSTQLLDNRLSVTKQEEFTTYREELRTLLRTLETSANISDFSVPVMPTYNE